MPGWHEKTKDLVSKGKLTVAGIVQEQHGERAALFMQWKQMDWPVMVDSLNLLGVRAVPLTYLIDEHGIIRSTNPKGDALNEFLSSDFEEPKETGAPTFAATDEVTRLAITALNQAEADATALDAALKEEPKGAGSRFRLGVLYRKRYDSPSRQPGDFSKAVAAWSAALEENPAQYIWRRRIQQYGPLLDKPYPFYNWVYEAKAAINGRGEFLVWRISGLSDAEIARPSKTLAISAITEHPDPDGKLPQDTLGLIEIEQTVVASTDKEESAHRVHLRFTPNALKKAHWNNDAGISAVWIGGNQRQIESKIWIHLATETGDRMVEFEFDKAAKSPIKGSAFYYVCEGSDGKCQYLRHDFEVVIAP